MPHRRLVALPVFNEAAHVDRVLEEVRKHSGGEILVIDDGSSDGTAEILTRRGDVRVVRHEKNRGYGAALLSAFRYSQDNEFDLLVTIDCDGQHEPCRIPLFFDACTDDVDIVSGSRYLAQFDGDTAPPPERRHINELITAEINRRLGLNLTDAFCGFKCYRVDSLRRVRLQETGYSMPLEFWVQSACAGLKIIELPVPLIYLDEKRSFGGVLDNGQARLDYYHQTLDRAITAARANALCGAAFE